MPIQAFSFPVPETRFFQVDHHVYKFRIKHGSKISCTEDMLDREFVSEELESAVRVVLMNLDNLHPFTTQHFNIFPYKSRWERVSELRFMKGDVKLGAYPFLITLYVENNEPVPQQSANHANEWVSSDRGPALNNFLLSQQSELKYCRTEQSQGGALNQGNNHIVVDRRHAEYLQESPYLADSAEGMVCGSELHADSEVPSQPVPGAKNPSIEAESREQDDSEISDCIVREKSGVLSRLTRIGMFLLALLFRRR